MKCQNCGTEHDFNFCPTCGAKRETQPESPAPFEAPPAPAAPVQAPLAYSALQGVQPQPPFAGPAPIAQQGQPQQPAPLQGQPATYYAQPNEQAYMPPQQPFQQPPAQGQPYGSPQAFGQQPYVQPGTAPYAQQYIPNGAVASKRVKTPVLVAAIGIPVFIAIILVVVLAFNMLFGGSGLSVEKLQASLAQNGFTSSDSEYISSVRSLFTDSIGAEPEELVILEKSSGDYPLVVIVSFETERHARWAFEYFEDANSAGYVTDTIEEKDFSYMGYREYADEDLQEFYYLQGNQLIVLIDMKLANMQKALDDSGAKVNLEELFETLY